MERKNFLKEVRLEKSRTKERQAELVSELTEAEAELEKNWAEYDAALLSGGKATDAALMRFQKSMLKTDGLRRVISDIEKRVLPSFNEREKDARNLARQEFYNEMKPVHEEAKKEIETMVLKIAEIVDGYIEQCREAESGWGSSTDHLFHFNGIKMPTSLKNALSFENSLTQEMYHPGPGYQPVAGGGSGWRPTDERASVVH